jgi:phenylacetic acid degradation operon negative regulatory protein
MFRDQIRPLTARSVILSILLGSHPPNVAVRTLVRAAEIFGVSEGTTRVALSRLAADGEVVADGSRYRLSGRLAERQSHFYEGLHPATRPWRGKWEVAIAGPDVRTAAQRAAAGSRMARLRLAQLRPGVWARPDNLLRPWPEDASAEVLRFEAVSRFERPRARDVVKSLWDLDKWAKDGRMLAGALRDHNGEPQQRFAIAAAMVRHLQRDPMLPSSLLPSGWPGGQLRSMLAEYEDEYRRLVRSVRSRQEPSR